MFSACAGVSSIASHTLSKRFLLIDPAALINPGSAAYSWVSSRQARAHAGPGRADIPPRGCGPQCLWQNFRVVTLHELPNATYVPSINFEASTAQTFCRISIDMLARRRGPG